MVAAKISLGAEIIVGETCPRSTHVSQTANDWTVLKDRRGKTRGRQPADREKQLLKEIRDLKAKLREREVQIAKLKITRILREFVNC